MAFDLNAEFNAALPDDIDAVTAIYKASVGTYGCTWDDEYPSRKTAHEDLAAGALYVLRKDNRIIGAVSLVSENELDAYECFTIKSGAREFARICVLSEFRSMGYGRYMLEELTKIARMTGATAWHILVAMCNPAAIALYRSFGFAFLGECEMYTNRYHIAEMVL